MRDLLWDEYAHYNAGPPPGGHTDLCACGKNWICPDAPEPDASLDTERGDPI